MPRLQRKSFTAPDQVRRFPNGRVEIVQLDETAIGRFVYEPGFRWSRDMAAVAGTGSCQHRHVGYAFGGHLGVQMDDGTTLELHGGEAFEIPPGHDAWVIGDVAWDSVEFTSARTFAESPEDSGQRILATILFTDIVGSTAMLETVGDARWRTLVLAHNDRVRAEIDNFRGREVATTGDGFLVTFDGAARGVRAAAAMIKSVRELGLEIRAGLHSGEVELVGGQARGVAVHAAARVAALAAAGEVLVSGTTRDLLDGSGLQFESRGTAELKGITGARAIFALVS
jgi:class 3 adenylate cyclase